MEKIVFVSLLFVSTLLIAQVEGDFNTSEYIELSKRAYNNIVDLKEMDDASFLALYSSYDYEDGLLAYDAVVVKFNVDGTLDSEFGSNGCVELTVAGFDQVIPKQIIVDEHKNVFVLCIGKVDVGTNTQKALLLKLTSEGVFDLAYADNGVIVLQTNVAYANVCRDFTLATEGSIIAVGYVIDPNELYDRFPVVFKITKQGVLDETFNSTGYKIFETLPPPSNSNARIAHVAGGYMQTVCVNTINEIIVAGRIANELESLNFIAKLNDEGSLVTSFEDEGYYFPSIDNIEFADFQFVTELPESDFLFGLTSSEAPFDYSYGVLSDDGFQINEIDINGQEDFLITALTGNDSLYLIGESVNTTNYNSVALPDENNLLVYNDNGFMNASISTKYSITIDEENVMKIESACFLSSTNQILLAGKKYNDTGFTAFITVLNKAALPLGMFSSATTTLDLYPTVANDFVYVDRLVQESSVLLTDEKGYQFDLYIDENVVDISRLITGVYYLKTEKGIGRFVKE